MQTRIRDLTLAKVPADGSAIGNISLLREVQQALEADGREYDEKVVKVVREQLTAQGVLGKGVGGASKADIKRELRRQNPMIFSWQLGVARK